MGPVILGAHPSSCERGQNHVDLFIIRHKVSNLDKSLTFQYDNCISRGGGGGGGNSPKPRFTDLDVKAVQGGRG